MQYTIAKNDGSEAVQVDDSVLALPGYVEYLLEQGYIVPGKYVPSTEVDEDARSNGSTAKGPAADRAVQYTPGRQPIYGSVATAKSAMDAMFAEKMTELKREQPALFPPDERVMEAGPAEQARDRKWVPPHRREKYAENSWSARRVRSGLAVIEKKLNLSAVLRDRSVQDKYGMTDTQLNLIQIMMQVSPEKAAIKATETLRDNGHKVLVIADMSAASRSVARAVIARAANLVGHDIRCREIPMTYLPGSMLVAMTPRDEDESGQGDYTWELTAPGREFTTAAALWVLIVERGPHAVVEQFGHEFGFLRIMITMIDRKTSEAITLSPEYEPHSGDRMEAWAGMTRELMGAWDSIQEIDFGCLPVTANGNVVLASAVTVNERWAVTPYHVLKTPGGKVNGDLMEKADVRRLGSSLYAVMVKTPLPNTPLVDMRAPVVGEAVTLRVVGFQGTSLTASTVVAAGQITSTTDSVWVKGCEAKPGASGSVYFAVSDGKALGLHDGQGPLGARLLPFSSDTHALLHDPVAWYAGGGPTLSRVLSPTVRYWSKGKKTRVTWTELAGRLGFNGSAMTILDGRSERAAVTLEQLAHQDVWTRAHDTDTPLARVYRGMKPTDSEVSTIQYRSGHDGEAVVLLCCDSEGLYMSSETAFGQECVFGRSNLTWMAMLRHGALVVAVSDVSVVGVVASLPHTGEWVTFRLTNLSCADTVSESDNSGKMYGPPIESNREWLRSKFPFLNVASYSPEALDECFTHSSCGRYELGTVVFSGYQNMARIGDAVMRARFHVMARVKGFDPSATTQLANRWQNNEVQAVVAGQFGLGDQLRRASRLTTIGQHGLADALEALTCLVYFHEDASVLDKFLRVIAMFGES